MIEAQVGQVVREIREVVLLRTALVAAFSNSLEGSITLRDIASDVRCLSGEPPAEEQPDQKQSRRERNRC